MPAQALGIYLVSNITLLTRQIIHIHYFHATTSTTGLCRISRTSRGAAGHWVATEAVITETLIAILNTRISESLCKHTHSALKTCNWNYELAIT